MSQTSGAMTRRALAFFALWGFCVGPAAFICAQEPTANWIRTLRAGTETAEEAPAGPPAQIRTLRGGQRGTETPYQSGTAPWPSPREPRRDMAPRGGVGDGPPPLPPLITKPTVVNQPPAPLHTLGAEVRPDSPLAEPPPVTVRGDEAKRNTSSGARPGDPAAALAVPSSAAPTQPLSEKLKVTAAAALTASPAPKVELPQVVRAAPAADAAETPTIATRPAVETVGTADRVDAATAHFFYRIAVVQVIANLVGSILTPVLFGAALYFGLRRWIPRISAPAPLELLTGEAALAAVTANDHAETALTFDLGPTYEEERQRKEAEAREQEAAMLQHIFEENLSLRDRLADLATASACAGSADGHDGHTDY
jgi:hypothetical protein